jgi:hypothetical protein
MRSQTHTICRWLGIACIGLMWCGFSAQTASASCGDWLQSHANGTDARPSNQHSETPAPRPCHGPGCRGELPLAPATPSVPTVRTSQDLACLFDSLVVKSESSNEWALTGEPLPSFAVDSDIFRPPRG